MHDETSPDPLLRAIAEFRAFANRLIDEQETLIGDFEAEWSQVRAAPAVAVAIAAPPPARPEPKPTADASEPADPRLRLDALAKHLDRKLRQATGTPG